MPAVRLKPSLADGGRLWLDDEAISDGSGSIRVKGTHHIKISLAFARLSAAEEEADAERLCCFVS